MARPAPLARGTPAPDALRPSFDYSLAQAAVNAVSGVVRRRVLCHSGARMLSMPHEALLLLFRNRPTLAAELLSDTLNVPLPTFTDARIEPGDCP